MKENFYLLVNGSHGVYVPCVFVNNFLKDDAGNIDPAKCTNWSIFIDDAVLLADGESCKANYWDTWADILNNAKIIIDGKTFSLYQDDDLWAICYESMTDEEKQNFGFEE